MTKIKFIFQILYGQIINKNTSKNITNLIARVINHVKLLKARLTFLYLQRNVSWLTLSLLSFQAS